MPSGLNSHFLVQIISTKNIIRSEYLESKLTELGIKFQISPGVVPNVIDFQDGVLHSAFLYKLLSQRTGSIGEIGCGLAHRVAMKNFLNSNHKFGIIFEDDAEVIADFDFNILTNNLNSDLPIIIVLGWIPGFAVAKYPQIPSTDEIIELMTAPTCTFAYAINRSAATLMIDGHEKIIDVVDWPIYALNKVNFYATRWPWVTASHDPKLSIIGVRSPIIPKSVIGVLASRIRMLTYLVTLGLLSKTKILKVSPKQIIHQLIIRGWLHRYGVSQVAEKLISNEVVPAPLKFQYILHLLKLN